MVKEYFHGWREGVPRNAPATDWAGGGADGVQEATCWAAMIRGTGWEALALVVLVSRRSSPTLLERQGRTRHHAEAPGQG
jgi:hypothetical protein